MAKAVINIKTDKEVKANVQKLAEELGISLSDVINASLRNFIRTREVRISSIPQMTPELERLIGKARDDFENKKNISGPFSTAKDMDAYLDAF
jgi:addiction module RelB/DinJ family antitoxin